MIGFALFEAQHSFAARMIQFRWVFCSLIKFVVAIYMRLILFSHTVDFDEQIGLSECARLGAVLHCLSLAFLVCPLGCGLPVSLLYFNLL